MSRNRLFIVPLLIACFFGSALFAQKPNYLGKQFLVGTSINGNPGWNDPEGQRFWLLAWNQRGAVGLTKRIFVGVQSRFFWSKANNLPVVQTWLGGGFARYYFMVPRGEKRRWAFSAELGNYWGNHFLTEDVGITGAVKKSGQSMPNLGFSLEMRAYKNLWIELAHNFLLVAPYDLTAYPSLGIVLHWGEANAFAR
ncbi:MAG: hypothetical protein KF734_04765 [Saprospiraceae bacterium]|nr:hypothetical protein [Saprospiraceae bacterium]